MKRKHKEPEKEWLKDVQGQYTIKLFYRTGDSFGSYSHEELIEIGWQTLEAARENANRIKEHYLTIEDVTKEEEVKDKPWFYAGGNFDCYASQSVKLTADSGVHFILGVSWIGYFDSLQAIEILKVEGERQEFIERVEVMR